MLFLSKSELMAWNEVFSRDVSFILLKGSFPKIFDINGRKLIEL